MVDKTLNYLRDLIRAQVRINFSHKVKSVTYFSLLISLKTWRINIKKIAKVDIAKSKVAILINGFLPTFLLGGVPGTVSSESFSSSKAF